MVTLLPLCSCEGEDEKHRCIHKNWCEEVSMRDEVIAQFEREAKAREASFNELDQKLDKYTKLLSMAMGVVVFAVIVLGAISVNS